MTPTTPERDAGLLDTWKRRLDAVDAPGEAVLVDEYRPSGLIAPEDVSEVAGLVVWDADGVAHHIRLHRDESATFIESPSDPDAPIGIDPMSHPVDRRTYLSTGVPEAVSERLDALGVRPRWGEACDDGSHTFVVENAGSKHEFKKCRRCGLPRATLSWLGHAVPRPPGRNL
jgi:hypothetical protein